MFVLLMVGLHRFLDAVVAQESLADTGVLGKDQIHLFRKDANGPISNVLQVADRGRDEEKLAHGPKVEFRIRS